jgi:hypothetical protein
MLASIDPGCLTRSLEWGRERGGYSNERYAASFAEFGKLLPLNGADSWLLVRKIAGTPFSDAIGAYPFFMCEDFSKCATEMSGLAEGVVSVALVPDPFLGLSYQQLQVQFDIAIPYKTHYLVDLDVTFDRYLRKNHRYYAKRSRSRMAVEMAKDASAYAVEWVELYRHLVERHGIAGLRAFSPKALAEQLSVPGCHYFRAVHENSVVGALICYLDRGVVYAHLTSTTPLGQTLMAQYALLWNAIEYFRGRAKWFELGGVPGSSDQDSGEGLAFFKRGWATVTCQAYFCGKILNRTRYGELCVSFGAPNSKHFPAYRGGVYT